MDNKLKEKMKSFGYEYIYNEKALTFKQINEKNKNEEEFIQKNVLQFVDDITSNKKFGKLGKRWAVKAILLNMKEMDNEITLFMSCSDTPDCKTKTSDEMYEIVNLINT